MRWILQECCWCSSGLCARLHLVQSGGRAVQGAGHGAGVCPLLETLPAPPPTTLLSAHCQVSDGKYVFIWLWKCLPRRHNASFGLHMSHLAIDEEYRGKTEIPCGLIGNYLKSKRINHFTMVPLTTNEIYSDCRRLSGAGAGPGWSVHHCAEHPRPVALAPDPLWPPPPPGGQRPVHRHQPQGGQCHASPLPGSSGGHKIFLYDIRSGFDPTL